ncbi:hypothetical protein ACTFJW_13600 [Clostridium cagae]|uniref:hypothetical protein n=1 Tax=Clostridium TaxID=1485 RepID=UPI0020792D9A|nr:hypothetical protein [Clostridium sp. ZBS12]
MYLNRGEKKQELKTKNKKRFIKYISLSFVLVAVILLIGFSYEKLGGYKDAKTVLENDHLGNLPIKILTNADDDDVWNNSQATLKVWSTNSEQILVNGARHTIYHTQPDVINKEILKLIENQK